MATAITPEQMKALESHQRHRDICTQWVRDIATFLRQTANGDVTWAQKRVIAAGVALHPNSQDYSEWIAQMTATQKGAVIWDGIDAEITPENLDATVDFLASGGGTKYDEMANDVYTLRATRIEF
jgi:hypothetical protein